MARYTMIRHYCKECGGRVFPFDKYDAQTEVPLETAHPVLLKSYNHEHKEERIAWCFNQQQWVECERETEDQFLQRYIRRRGVLYRGGRAPWATVARR